MNTTLSSWWLPNVIIILKLQTNKDIPINFFAHQAHMPDHHLSIELKLTLNETTITLSINSMMISTVGATRLSKQMNIIQSYYHYLAMGKM